MSMTTPQFTTTLSLEEMESLIRRVVKEAVHEEFARVMQQLPASSVDDWTHEGPDDPEGDRLLLAEALVESERYRSHPEEHLGWNTFKAELREAEAAGELPD
jgi:hypothetical protein